MRSRTMPLAGLMIGIALGALFGLAVVSFADCTGPDCAYQRLVGVVAHAAGVGVVGATVGLLVQILARLVQLVLNRLR